MYSTPPTTFHALLEPWPAEVREIANWLRSELLAAFPQLVENVSGGRSVGTALYSVGAPDRVAVGMQPGKGFVKFFLHDPGSLPSSSFKLEGAGKHTRHIKLYQIPAAKAELLALARVPIERRSEERIGHG